MLLALLCLKAAKGTPSLLSVCLLWKGNVYTGAPQSLHFQATSHASFQRSMAEGSLLQDKSSAVSSLSIYVMFKRDLE